MERKPDAVSSEDLKGWYHKPHFLMGLLREWKITKSEFCLLDYLYHRWAWYHYMDGSFYRTDVQICATGLISQKNLTKARRSLKEKKYIDFVKGCSHKATQYFILINPEDYGFNPSQHKDSEES